MCPIKLMFGFNYFFRFWLVINRRNRKTGFHFFADDLLRLNQMLYSLCLLHYSNTETVLFACLSSGWATITGRLLQDGK